MHENYLLIWCSWSHHHTTWYERISLIAISRLFHVQLCATRSCFMISCCVTDRFRDFKTNQCTRCNTDLYAFVHFACAWCCSMKAGTDSACLYQFWVRNSWRLAALNCSISSQHHAPTAPISTPYWDLCFWRYLLFKSMCLQGNLVACVAAIYV